MKSLCWEVGGGGGGGGGEGEGERIARGCSFDDANSTSGRFFFGSLMEIETIS